MGNSQGAVQYWISKKFEIQKFQKHQYANFC